MLNENIINGLQLIVTNLSQQAIGHKIQSKVFTSQGFTKLGDKYAEHCDEEMGYVDQCIDRILDLGGDIKNEAKVETPVFTDPVEYIKYDYQISVDGLADLKKIIDLAKDDLTTYDILKDYYKDEEEDMYWGETQLELIDKIGLQNWLYQQL